MMLDKKVELGKYTAKAFKRSDIEVGRIAVVGWHDSPPARGVIVEWNRSWGGKIFVPGKEPWVMKFDGADQIIELEGFITKI